LSQNQHNIYCISIILYKVFLYYIIIVYCVTINLPSCTSCMMQYRCIDLDSEEKCTLIMRRGADSVRWGHRSGDSADTIIASIIRASLRSADTVRWGHRSRDSADTIIASIIRVSFRSATLSLHLEKRKNLGSSPNKSHNITLHIFDNNTENA
jgi:hypothetical protein